MSDLITDIKNRCAEPGVIDLLAAAQIHRTPEEAKERGPQIARDYHADSRHLWGYERDGDIVALIGLEETRPHVAIIRDMAVSLVNQRHGIGRALINYVRDELGYTQLKGNTLDSAAGFYERCGFSTSPGDYLPDGRRMTRFAWRSSR